MSIVSSETTNREQLAQYYTNKLCPACGRGAVDNACLSCSDSPIPHIRHDTDYLKQCTTCSAAFLLTKGEPDHVSIGYCACVDWMKWKISPGGAKQLSSAAEAGSILGKQIEGDRVLASKLDAEEQARKGAEIRG